MWVPVMLAAGWMRGWLRIVTGPDQNHLAHATVYMRLQGVDAKWQFYGQDWDEVEENQLCMGKPYR